MVEQQPGQGENRVHRRAKLVTHVGEKPALELVGAPQMLGLLIEFGVERHHATVGVLELAIEPEEVVLPDAQRLQGVEQLLVLLLHLGQRVMGPLLHQGIHELVQVRSDEHGRLAGQELLQPHGRALVWRGRDMHLIHEPLGAAQAQAQAGRRLVLPGENLQVENTGPWSLIATCKSCGRVWPSRWNSTCPPPA